MSNQEHTTSEKLIAESEARMLVQIQQSEARILAKLELVITKISKSKRCVIN